MADWIPEQQQADKVKIDGQWTPGTCSFDGLSSVRDYEVIDAIGLSGGTVRFRGRKLSRFKILLHLYDPDDWADYYKIKPTLDQLPIGKNAKSHSVSHPLIAAVGVKAVVFEEISAPELTQETGEWTVTLSCIEYREPKVEMAKVKGATATKADPVDEAIDKKTAELEALNDSYAGAPT